MDSMQEEDMLLGIEPELDLSLLELEAAVDGVTEDPGTAQEWTDEQLLAYRKSEAKQLGEKTYKRWKKLLKRNGGGRREKTKKKEKRAREDSKDEAEAEDPYFSESMLEEHDPPAQPKKRTSKRAPTVLKAAQNRAAVAAAAEVDSAALLKRMKLAARADEQAVSNPERFGPPLHRISIKKDVQSACAKKAFAAHLFKGNILDLLCGWLIDLRTNKLAPLELRSTALDILLGFPVVPESADSHQQYEGLSRETLLTTGIGRAVNALRVNAGETSLNRAKCSSLLERFSRVMTNISRERDQGATVDWKCKGTNSAVASPFEVVQTASDKFQEDYMRPNPLDPTSYHNLLPPRHPAQLVTNASGTLTKALKDVTDMRQDENKRRKYDLID